MYLGPCDACKAGRHEKHEEYHHTPPRDGGFICGGGYCKCEGECQSQLSDENA